MDKVDNPPFNIQDISPPANLFNDVKFSFSGEVDKKLIKILENGGGKHRLYVADDVTHFFAAADADELKVDEAKDIFDIPILSPSWIAYSAKTGKLLPLQWFTRDSKKLFSNVNATASSIKNNDLKKIWAMLTYNGGKFSKTLNKDTTHLITNSCTGNKHKVANGEGIKIVCSDWLTLCIKENQILDEKLFNPSLLIKPENPKTTTNNLFSTSKIAMMPPESILKPPEPIIKPPEPVKKTPEPIIRPLQPPPTFPAPPPPPPPVLLQRIRNNEIQPQTQSIQIQNTQQQQPVVSNQQILQNQPQPLQNQPQILQNQPQIYKTQSGQQIIQIQQPQLLQDQTLQQPSQQILQNHQIQKLPTQIMQTQISQISQHSQNPQQQILHIRQQSPGLQQQQQQQSTQQIIQQSQPGQPQTIQSSQGQILQIQQQPQTIIGQQLQQQQVNLSQPQNQQQIQFSQQQQQPRTRLVQPFTGNNIQQQNQQLELVRQIQNDPQMRQEWNQMDNQQRPIFVQKLLQRIRNNETQPQSQNTQQQQQPVVTNQQILQNQPQLLQNQPQLLQNQPQILQNQPQIYKTQSGQQIIQIQQPQLLQNQQPNQQILQNHQIQKLPTQIMQTQISQISQHPQNPQQQILHIRQQSPGLQQQQQQQIIQQSQHGQPQTLQSSQGQILQIQQQTQQIIGQQLQQQQGNSTQPQNQQQIQFSQQLQQPRTRLVQPFTSNNFQQQNQQLEIVRQIQSDPQMRQEWSQMDNQQRPIFVQKLSQRIRNNEIQPQSQSIQNQNTQQQQPVVTNQQILQNQPQLLQNQPQLLQNQPQLLQNQPQIYKTQSGQQIIQIQQPQLIQNQQPTQQILQNHQIQKLPTQIMQTQISQISQHPQNPQQQILHIRQQSPGLQQQQQQQSNQQIIQQSQPGQPQTIQTSQGQILQIQQQPQTIMGQQTQPIIGQQIQQQVNLTQPQNQQQIQFSQQQQQPRTRLVQPFTGNNFQQQNQQLELVRQIQNDPQMRQEWNQMDNQQRPIFVQKLLQRIRNNETQSQSQNTQQQQQPVVTNQQILQNQPQLLQNQPQLLQNQSQLLQNQPQLLQNQPQILQNQPQIYKTQSGQQIIQIQQPQLLQNQTLQQPTQQILQNHQIQKLPTQIMQTQISQISQHPQNPQQQILHIRQQSPGLQQQQQQQSTQQIIQQSQPGQPQTIQSSQGQILQIQQQPQTIIGQQLQQQQQQGNPTQPQNQQIQFSQQQQQPRTRLVQPFTGNNIQQQNQQLELVRQIQNDPQMRQQWNQMDNQQRTLLIQKLVQRNREEQLKREMMYRQINQQQQQQQPQPQQQQGSQIISVPQPGQPQQQQTTTTTILPPSPQLPQQTQPQQQVQIQQQQQPPSSPALGYTPSNLPFVQVVNSKTKTALANLLSNRLQGSTIPDTVNTITMSSPRPSTPNTQVCPPPSPAAINSTQPPPPPPISPAVQNIQIIRKTLSTLSNPIIKNVVPSTSTNTMVGSPTRLSAPGRSTTIATTTASTLTHQRPQFYGHDSNINVGKDNFLLGCVFWIVESEQYLNGKKEFIFKFGGEIEINYSGRVTHVVCPHQKFPEFHQVLRDGKRIVSPFWLHEMFVSKTMVPPSIAIHLPIAYKDNDLPLQDKEICLTGFNGFNRCRIKYMCQLLGAKGTSLLYNNCLCLVAEKNSGKKYQKAREWKLPVVNVQFLNELLFGHTSALEMIHSPKYQVFNVENPFRFDYSLTPHLMAAWKAPIRVSNECLEKFKKNKRELSQTPEMINKKRIKLEIDEYNKGILSPVSLSEKENNPTEKEEPSTGSTPVATENLTISASASATSTATSLLESEPVSNKEPDSQIPLYLSVIIITSGFSKSFKEKMQIKVEMLGGRVTENYREATYLIVRDNHRGPMLFKAIPHVKYIINSKWLGDSILKSKFQDPSQYPFYDQELEKIYDLPLLSTLKEINRETLFSGMTFYITARVQPSKQIMREVIESSGGTIEKQIFTLSLIRSRAIKSPKKYIIVTCPEDMKFIDTVFKKSKSFPTLYSPEFIFKWIWKQRVKYIKSNVNTAEK